MMPSLGSLALLCIPLSVLGLETVLVRVDITIPQIKGRRECDDILNIERILAHLPEVKVLFARKAMDNQNVILVLGVDDISHWSSLSLALSKMGYHLIVTPLQTCKEYAKEFGSDVDYLLNDHQRYELLYFVEVVFYDQGITTNDYIGMIKRKYEKDEDVIKNLAVQMDCYRSYGDLPIKMMYFVPKLNTTEMFKVQLKERTAGKAHVDVNFLQSFKSYTEVC